MKSTLKRIGIAVCVVASLVMSCCKNSSDARAVNVDAQTVNEDTPPGAHPGDLLLGHYCD